MNHLGLGLVKLCAAEPGSARGSQSTAQVYEIEITECKKSSRLFAKALGQLILRLRAIERYLRLAGVVPSGAVVRLRGNMLRKRQVEAGACQVGALGASEPLEASDEAFCFLKTLKI